ncbi:alpha/beta hydrolase [Phreatobacter stygius]|uniref:Alpha/beta hydrolase n=1 Tax=Phreatobacter stygius TaxID=1940610 RepID=A0A4D7AVL7_9HYPH|nr:alpha/beta hydrolase [Phreatobacter stygius]QCI65754.1 alpha/beta hydrolase [Phreatobacter stygius]
MASLIMVVSTCVPVRASELVPQFGSSATLDRPTGRPRGSIILMPGGDGRLGIQSDGNITALRGNQLVRTRHVYAARGFATLTLDAAASPAQAVEYMRTIARPVVVVATSRGATRAPAALSARPDGIVLTSAMLDTFQAYAGSPGALPRTLVLHHRQDGCRVTQPALVAPFAAWAGGRARVVWLTGGVDRGDPCQAGGHHGLAGLDGQVVSLIVAFANSLRGAR